MYIIDAIKNTHRFEYPNPISNKKNIMFQFYKEKITKYSIKINFKYFYIYIYKDKKIFYS